MIAGPIARRGALALAVAAALAACDDVSEADRTILMAEVAAHVRTLNLEERSGGFYSFAPKDPVRYLKLPHTSDGAPRHAISIWVVQNDEQTAEEPAPAGDRRLAELRERAPMTDAAQVLRHPPEFYQRNICPPAAVIGPYAGRIQVYLNLFSRRFERQFRIPCQ